MIVPSKELLGEVLGQHIEICEISENLLLYSSHHCPDPRYDRKINVYELAHKLKKFAYSKGYNIYSSINGYAFFGSVYDNIEQYYNTRATTTLDIKTEIDSIFFSCEWIYKKELTKQKGKE